MNQPNPWQIGLWIAVAFPIYFALLWIGICWLLSWLSRWRRLAHHYRTDQVPPGKAIGSFWAMMGIVSYRGTLTLQPAPEGLYLKMMVLFRIGHPSLLIPWSAVKLADAGGKGLFNTTQLTLGDPVITTLRVPGASINEEVLQGYLR